MLFFWTNLQTASIYIVMLRDSDDDALESVLRGRRYEDEDSDKELMILSEHDAHTCCTFAMIRVITNKSLHGRILFMIRSVLLKFCIPGSFSADSTI
jgi:hypothetical protein